MIAYPVYSNRIYLSSLCFEYNLGRRKVLNKGSASSGSIFRRMIPGLILAVLVIAGLALAGDIRQVSQLILRFDWKIFPIVLLFTLFNYALRFLKWHFYLRQVGVDTIPWQNSLRLFIGGFPLAVTPGKVGEALKGVWVNQLSSLPVGKGISVVVAERISDGLAVLLLATLGVIAYPRYWVAFALIFFTLALIISISQIRPAALWMLSIGERLPLVRHFIGGIRDFYEGSFVLFRPKPTIMAVSLGTISWLGEGIGFYLILIGLGLSPGLKLATIAIFVLSFSTVVGGASTLPGGLGVIEASIAGMLTFLVGIESSLAVGATLLIRLATLWFGFALGLLVWTFSPDLLGLRGKNEPAIES
jgi:uncharacterized protein (TIRG00374 family)